MEKEYNCQIALMGNPNVGKSTVFNALTGLHQHTGNWPGKTVSRAEGSFRYCGVQYTLVDLPGTYSLLSRSEEEAVASEFIRTEKPLCTVVVCDATSMERSLMLALQVMELTDQVIVCVNLMDEAKKRGYQINAARLEKMLGVPVVCISAGSREGLEKLAETIRSIADGFIQPKPQHILQRSDTLAGRTQAESDRIATRFFQRTHTIIKSCIREPEQIPMLEKADRLFLHRIGGYAVMLILLLVVFWLTIEGANYPSMLLEKAFAWLREVLYQLFDAVGISPFFRGMLIDGMYATTAKVVAVMLPPMAIFFPLFTILEDLGYLPRVAFLLDRKFSRCGACGKQALTMCLGVGCNAAGVVGCRIIDSPRERLIAILTNAFIPCNGRFPALILLSTVFFSKSGNAWLAAGILTMLILLSVYMTFLASKLLNRTVLRGQASSFVMELPHYRRPKIVQILVRSLKDRTLFVLGRAAAVAAPAGIVIWLLGYISIDGVSLLNWLARILEPIGGIMGLNGAILAAFLLACPANELVMPVLCMILSSGSMLTDFASDHIASSLLQNGWSWQTALCTLIFILFHWPCTTTVLTIKKETGSLKWTWIAVLLPTLFGFLLCSLLAGLFRIMG